MAEEQQAREVDSVCLVLGAGGTLLRTPFTFTASASPRRRLPLTTNYEFFPEDMSWFELTVMTPNKDPHRLPTARRTDYGTLVGVCDGLHAWLMLTEAGASAMSPRAEIFGEESNRADYLAVTFPTGNRLVPAVAYVLTRLIPLKRMSGG